MQLQMQSWIGTRQAVIQWCWELLQVKPYIKGTCGRDVDVEMKLMESVKDVITFYLEVLLEGDLEG
jgi:hypothetical protein